MSDIEIARQATMLNIMEIGAKLNIPAEALRPYGHDKAKVDLAYIDTLKDKEDGNRPKVGFYGGGSRIGTEHFESILTPEAIAQEAVRMSEAQFGARRDGHLAVHGREVPHREQQGVQLCVVRVADRRTGSLCACPHVRHFVR